MPIELLVAVTGIAGTLAGVAINHRLASGSDQRKWDRDRIDRRRAERQEAFVALLVVMSEYTYAAIDRLAWFLPINEKIRSTEAPLAPKARPNLVGRDRDGELRQAGLEAKSQGIRPSALLNISEGARHRRSTSSHHAKPLACDEARPMEVSSPSAAPGRMVAAQSRTVEPKERGQAARRPRSHRGAGGAFSDGSAAAMLRH